MKRLLAACVLVMACCLPLSVQASIDYTGAEWVPGHLMVDFAPVVGTLQDRPAAGVPLALGIPEVDDLLARYKVTTMYRVVDDHILSKLDFTPDFFRLMVLLCPPETDILQMRADFEACPFVTSAEPDLLRPVLDRIPNDPLWNSQWDKRLMQLPRAWEFSTGSREIICVAVDGGTYWPHVDFFANLWVNPGEDIDGDQVPYVAPDYPGDYDDLNGVDDDQNGKTDDFIGWDFIRNISGCAAGEDCDSQEDNDPTSVGDHGTHVLGIMGARGNNGIGVTGANWNVRIMASRAGYTRASDGQGYIVQSASIPCMLWANAHGARIINMSYGSSSGSSQEANAILACWNNGAVLCGAAGNDGVPNPHYPANHPHVIAVGSVNSNDALSDFTNRGTWVDCYAPGNTVMSTVIPGYTDYPGTSMASPNAAGVIALLWSIFPDMTNQQIEDLALDNCADIRAANPGVNPAWLGAGRIDAALPLASRFPYLSIESYAVYGDNDDDNRLEPGENGSFVMTLHNDAEWSAAQNIQVVISSSDPYLTVTGGNLNYGNIAPGASVENSNTPVQIGVAASIPEDAYWTSLNVSITGNNGLAMERSLMLRIGRPQTLVVADDGQDTYHRFFVNSLVEQTTGYNHDFWRISESGALIFADVHEYEIIVWVCGNQDTGTLTADDQALLSQFLDGGGKLFLAGQGVANDIGGTPFFGNYLHAQATGLAGGRDVRAVAGDPISDGMNLLLLGGGCGGNGMVGPDQIVPVNGGVGFYEYSGGGTGAVHFDNSTYKTVYFAFAVEAACGANNTTHHSVIIRRAMDWFGARISDAEPRSTAELPAGFALRANYPNPFNPATTVAFELPRTSAVTIKIFDVQGRQVDVLVNRQLPAGVHTVRFDASHLASGLYFAHMEADGFRATRRMLLLK